MPIENEEFHKLLEYPWCKLFITFMRPTAMDALFNNAVLSFSNKHNDFLIEHWPMIKELTLVDLFRLGNLLDILDQVKNIEGDIIECGSFKGGTGLLMALFCKAYNMDKRIHLFDSFKGLPEPDQAHDKGYKKGQFVANDVALCECIKIHGLEDVIDIHAGWFKDTIPEFLKTFSSNISLLHIDCDLYVSTHDCFPHFYPKVTSNGAIILDDFNDGGRGEKKAVLETLASDKQQIHIGPAPQAYFYKNEVQNTDSKGIVSDAGFCYNLNSILANKSYLNWIESELQESYTNQLLNFLEKGVCQ